MGSLGSSQTLSIVDASIADLSTALSSGLTTSVALTAKHLIRISKYDRRTLTLNALPLLNPDAFSLAQASDDRRASSSSGSAGPLDGIPCTIKDSYKIKGMPVASGSPAFRNLMANEDAFTVENILQAGGVVLGRTNMPPMAAGGMQRGVYGRAESPYNLDYLTAAFASGSSNGSATATAASFGVFGMGEETISSGRSPASNNGLVAYTPSRGVISLRGNWPLFPTCDVVVPHTRSVQDMFYLLDAIAVEDGTVTGDFWREQPFVKLPSINSVRPKSYHDLADSRSLAGKKVGVPKMYIGGTDSDPTARKVHTRQSVVELWGNARKVLESLGATVLEVDFPVVTKFEKPAGGDIRREDSAPPHKNGIDMCQLMAYAWDDFLRNNGDAKVATSLAQIDSATIFPRPPGALPDRYDDNDPLVRHTDVVAHITNGRLPTFDIPGLGPALQKLEDTRKADYEDWMAELGLDAIVWPCNGDVGRADADVDKASQRDAWRNGVLYSNGNCVIRQLGIPTVSVPMGVMADTKMPVNLTFASSAYDDSNLLRYAYAFESASHLRQPPTLTPELGTDRISGVAGSVALGSTAPELSVKTEAVESAKGRIVNASGSASDVAKVEVFVDGDEVAVEMAADGMWTTEPVAVKAWTGRQEEKGEPSPEKSMVIVLATGKNGRSSGKMIFV